MKNQYQDSSEDFLLNFFHKSQKQLTKEIYKVLNNNPSWPILYHLSPQREFLLSWYPFKKRSSLLEIGAGCGALTGLLCQKVKKVTANELTEKRAKIIKKRWADLKNLEIIKDNILNYKTKEKYDYVTLIGVLEYAGKFFENTNDFEKPFINLIKLTKNFLNKKGTLLIAIENKIGLKYLAGGKEDHYGLLFESIENYPSYEGIRTFTKSELTNILIDLKFKKINFYYPFPDYKLPYLILTSEMIKKLNIPPSSYLPIIDLSNERLNLFNEIIFGHHLIKENILDIFSNSFLIEAKL